MRSATSSFEFAAPQRIVVGPGTRACVAEATAGFGSRPLLVTGRDAARAAWLEEELARCGVRARVHRISAEPTVEAVDIAVRDAREGECDVVVGCGGGASLDAAKAIAALLANGGEALDYVEGVGRGRTLTRSSIPFIAVPTTAGTGSEVTKNAVLAVPTERAKVSMRSDRMLARLAVVDAELTHSTPPAVTASTGLDALTHLIEAYVSNRANPLTDGLCREGIVTAAGSLAQAHREGSNAVARERMACVSLFGGLALANAKLGAVHGFAGPAGGMFDAPHGCLCGRFLPFVIEANVRALERRVPGSPALARHAEIAAWLTGDAAASPGDGVDWIQRLCAELAVPSLSHHGVTEADVDDLVSRAQHSSSMQGNPIVLERDELRALVRSAL